MKPPKKPAPRGTGFDVSSTAIAPGGVERRTFIQQMAATGFVLAAGPGGVRGIESITARVAASGARSAASAFEPSVYLSIADTGMVSVIVHRSEMGQGARTTLMMTMADELEADWSKVRLEQAIGDPKYGSQNTDGSTSIRDGTYMTFRQVGAVARTVLEQAAAAEWGVPVSEVAGKNGTVVHAKTKRSIGYGKLVARAKTLPVPKDVPLKAPKDFRFIGKKVPSVDLHSVVTGKAGFGQDATLPGMKYAVIAHPPVYGSKVVTFDAAAALKVPGVEKVIEVPGSPVSSVFMPLGGVAVIATSTWAAISGRKALNVTWGDCPNDSYDSVAYRAEIESAARAAGNVARNVGDAGTVLESTPASPAAPGSAGPAAAGAAPTAKGAKRIDAEYYVPHLSQAPMEPPAALAKVTGDKCEAWACSQDPQAARDTVAAMIKVPKENVTVHVTLLGGGFGRKSKPDYIAEAAWLAQATGSPVKVIWTREDDIRNGFIHTVSAQRMEGALNGAGKLTALRHRIASPSIFSIFGPDPGFHSDMELAMGVTDMPYSVPNIRVEVCKAPAHARIGWYRSVSNIPHAFAIGSFMDELAHAAGKDPLAFLLESLGPDRVIDMTKTGATKPVDNYGAKWEDHPNDTARHRRVLEAVAKEAGWGKKLPAGEGLGIAVHRSFLTYVAAVVHARVGARGLVIPRVDIAMDCGFAVNPDRVRSQCEGAVGMALSNALTSELTYARGAAVQGNYNDYKVLRMNAVPKEIHVHLVHQNGPIGGVGEPGVPPIAPALANAIFAASGKRIRSLPIGDQLTNG